MLHAIHEKRVLQQLQYCPLIIYLQDTFECNHKCHFVLPFLGGGELFFHLQRCGTFTVPMTQQYCAQIVMALGYMHRRAIIYNDLKPENIMLDCQGYLQLG